MSPAASTASSLTPPPLPAGRDRIHALDALRAVAMFLGIALHAGLPFATEILLPGMGGDVSRHWSFDVMLAFIHGFRMHLFFFLAGYFGRLLHERLGWKEFVRQRLQRIGLPFLIGMCTFVPMVVVLAVWQLARHDQPIPNPGPGFGIPTVHLWFLNYLLYLYGGAVVAAVVAKKFPAWLTRAFDRILAFIFQTPLRLVAFVPLTMICLRTGPWWGEPTLPINRLQPEPWTLAHYAVFFTAGWWLRRQPTFLQALKKFIVPTFMIALTAFAGQELATMQTPKGAVVFCAALFTWAMVFGLTGLFLKVAGAPKPWARYLADASYWCYLAHLPLVMLFQIALERFHWPAWGKFLLILAAAMALLLGSYERVVRYTWIGRLLNGPRFRGNNPPELGTIR